MPQAAHVCQQLLDGNRTFVDRTNREDPTFFERLKNGQKPKYLWIGCSDSRVPADRITDTNPGEIFVHRNIANMVVHTDINLLSVVLYAVKHLEVEHVIVCGHYGCGGVAAAVSNQDLGLIDNWLRNIKDVYRRHQRELEALDAEKRSDRLVELNVKEQVYNLCTTAIIQDAWKQKGRELHVHGWVYNVGDGLIRDLDVNIDGPEDLDKVYRLEHV